MPLFCYFEGSVCEKYGPRPSVQRGVASIHTMLKMQNGTGPDGRCWDMERLNLFVLFVP